MLTLVNHIGCAYGLAPVVTVGVLAGAGYQGAFSDGACAGRQQQSAFFDFFQGHHSLAIGLTFGALVRLGCASLCHREWFGHKAWFCPTAHFQAGTTMA